MNIKTKALAIVSGVILALSAFYVLQGIVLHNRQLDATIQAEEATIDAMVGDVGRYCFSPYQARLGNILEENPDLVRAFAARDRARLLELCLPILARRRVENPFLHAWDFNLPDGTVFLRVQDPAAHGDNISGTREMIRAVHESRESVSGFDVGRHGPIYWVARPVFHQGRYVGATELGLPAEQLAEALERRFKTPVAVTVKAAQWQKATMVGKGYRVRGDNVLIAPEHSLYMQIPDEAAFSGGEERVRVGRGDFMLHKCAVLRDYRGRAVGNVLVLQDITERLEHRRTFILGGVTASGLLLAVCFSVLYASFGTLIGRLEKSAAETARAKEEIERSHDELEQRVLERTAELQQANLTLAREATERIEMDKALWDSHDRLLRVLDGLDAVVYVADLDTYEILFANQFARNTFGDLVGKKCWQTIQPGQSGPCSFCTNRSLVGPDGQPTGVSTWEFENGPLGKWFAIQERAIPWVDNRLVRLAIATDVTARKIDEERIRASLRDKELLLKEVHHRVKNNMQIISSLLRLQESRGQEKASADLFRDSQSRIRAMSLIHEKLYQSADLARIDMGDYLGSLVGNLALTHGAAAERVRTRVDADRISLNMDTAVLCGLIVNELVTNSLKHAFPGDRSGSIQVSLMRHAAADGGEGPYELVVQDDGIGMPQGVALDQSRTLGLQLVTMLARHQLQGEIELARDGGTRFSVRFRELRYPNRT